jgi:hypothetical protein
MKFNLHKIFIALIVSLFFAAVAANAQTSSFSYQGKLTEGALAANGSYQMQFALFNAATGGNQIGATQTNSVAVTNGVFMVNLGFGAAAFDGTDRFLQISVFSVSTNSFVALTPRQQITSAPYAIKSLKAETSDNSLNLGGISANQYVQTTDPRMTDSRSPTAGSNFYIRNDTSLQAADLYLSGEIAANGYNSNFGYSINGDTVLDARGIDNYFVGYGAGGGTTTGTGNSFFGRTAGFANTTGSNNSLLGRNTNVGSGNLSFATAIGASSVVTTSNTIVLGRIGGLDTVQIPGVLNVANQYNLGGNRVLSIAGTDNIFVGAGAGTANTTGSSNAFFGRFAGTSNTTGINNAFFGRSAGSSNTAGINNSFFGNSAGISNTTGDNNAFFGRSTGAANSNGEFNAFFGAQAGLSNTTGYSNTFVGGGAGDSNTTGSYNTFFGYLAGADNTTGGGNTYIGYNAKGAAGIFNATAIGSGAFADASNQIVLGTSSDAVLAKGSLYVDGFINVGTLGGGGTVPLCRNLFTKFISTCAAPLAEGDSASLLNAVKEQNAQIESLKQQIELLKKLVCAGGTQAEVCRK